MYKYLIEGKHPIKGSIKASGNKNSALPCIAASILTKNEVTLRNIPDIEDSNVMIEILLSLGAKVNKFEANALKIDCSNISNFSITAELAKKVRASILFAGPMLARFKKVQLAPPGGDVIGRRRIDTHLLALEALGAKIVINKTFNFSADKLSGADIFLDEASVTGTENAIMAAVLAKGKTIIRNAASEPHVQDLCKLLNSMGGNIHGIGSNFLIIEGVDELHGADFSIGPDYMEIGSFIGLAAVSSGTLNIENIEPEDLNPLKTAFGKLGVIWKIENKTLKMSAHNELKVVSDFGSQIPKIEDAPWPGFPADITSIITVVATQAIGTILIHEKMFESRMFWVDKLIGMGARIVLCDPHRAVISGPSKLRGDTLTSPDVRAGMAMIIAALCAEGQSIINNIYQVERGYENICNKLQNIGANIKRIES